MLGNIGPMEMIIVAIIALVLLGPKRLPDAGRSLGRGMREFKAAITGDEPAKLPAFDEDPSKLTPAA
ncbi:MAG: twin-arginine translocation protein TatA/E family subunit [Solirubrobacterales bacterium]|nr:twin-arginine translocation protein TatA/E family subunit [Solirubrobacterales bacterium]